MATFLGPEWAEVLARVLGHAPSEQAGLADLVVCAAIDLQQRIQAVAEQVEDLSLALGMSAAGAEPAGAGEAGPDIDGLA